MQIQLGKAAIEINGGYIYIQAFWPRGVRKEGRAVLMETVG